MSQLQVGKSECKGSSYHEVTNRNGEYLLNLMRECEVLDLSTIFCKRQGKLWTFTYPNGGRAQLDHVLINRKWKNGAVDCQAYSTFHAIRSDHRPVTARIRLSLRANKMNKNKKVPYDSSKLITDENVKNAYSIEVRNRYQALQGLADDDTANTMYKNIMVAHTKSAELHVPLKVKVSKRLPWENDRTIEKHIILNEV